MFLICSIICVIIGVVLSQVDEHFDVSDIILHISAILEVFGILITFLLCVVWMIGNVMKDSEVAKYQQKYNAIVYKMESEACRDEFGLLSKEVIDEAQAWNETLASDKALQDNFWIGNLMPHIYDQFEFIDLNSYSK